MTDTKAARFAAWNRIGVDIRAAVSPYQFEVIPGGIERMPGPRAVTWWFDGEREKGMTLGNVMVIYAIPVRMLWRNPATDRDREARELEMWNVTREVQAALRGDSDLRDNVTSLDITIAERGQVDVGTGEESLMLDTIDFELLIEELEGEAIAI